MSRIPKNNPPQPNEETAPLPNNRQVNCPGAFSPALPYNQAARRERIEQVRRLLAQGRYEIPAMTLAERMLDHKTARGS